MTLLEISLLLVDLLALSLLISKTGQRGHVARLLVWAGLALGIVTCIVEPPRWQMYPAVLLSVTLAAYSLTGIGTSGKFRWLVALFGYSALAASMVLGLLLPVFSLPIPDGPFEIGTDVRVWMRTELATGSLTTSPEPRRLIVQLWYPAQPGQKGKTAQYRDADSGTPLTKYLQLVSTHAKIGVQVARSQQKFPVLLFSPLWNSGRSPYTFFYEMLASHGFIVAAIEHPLDYPNVDFEIVSRKDTQPLDARLAKRVSDVGFVLDQLKKMNSADAGELFAGKLDLDRVGIVGHSFGGSTAAESCLLDQRFKAGLSLDGNLYGTVADGSPTQPFFFMESDGPSDLGPLLSSKDADRKLWAELEQLDRSRKINWLQQRGGYFLQIRGSIHMDYSDHPFFSPIKRLSATSHVDPATERQVIGAYLLAFFEKYLNGRDEPILEKSPSSFSQAKFFHYPSPDAPENPFASGR